MKKSIFDEWLYHGSTVVANLTHHPYMVGSDLSTGTGREKVPKIFVVNACALAE
jgi:hypothetical protein